MFLVNSRLGLFSAAPLRELPLSRSYGTILPSSLTTLLPLALGFSPHLPVSVCGTGTLVFHMAFLATEHHGLPYYKFGPFRPGQPTPGFRYLHVSPCLKFGGYGISTVCASTTPFGLALAPDLPWADEPSPGNLRLSTARILTSLSLLIPAFSLLLRPLMLSL